MLFPGLQLLKIGKNGAPGKCDLTPVIPSQCAHWRGNPFSFAGETDCHGPFGGLAMTNWSIFAARRAVSLCCFSACRQ
jgi:hypothetical protein